MVAAGLSFFAHPPLTGPLRTMHIGKAIQNQIVSSGMTVVSFAKAIPTSRVNAYRIFQKDNIDIKLLERICVVLNHDFFMDLSHDGSVAPTV